MAEDRRMTAAQVVDKLMGSEHADVVRESVAWVVAELMEAEVAGQIGAELGEIAPDRVTHRNGYRPRAWQTRAGEIELAIPKLRSGSYFPSFLEPRKRSEQALVAVVQEALRQRGLHAQGRPLGRADGAASEQGPGLEAVPWPR
jgi:putative transposase